MAENDTESNILFCHSVTFWLLITLLSKSFCGVFTIKFYVLMFRMLFWGCLNHSQQHFKHP